MRVFIVKMLLLSISLNLMAQDFIPNGDFSLFNEDGDFESWDVTMGTWASDLGGMGWGQTDLFLLENEEYEAAIIEQVFNCGENDEWCWISFEVFEHNNVVVKLKFGEAGEQNINGKGKYKLKLPGCGAKLIRFTVNAKDKLGVAPLFAIDNIRKSCALSSSNQFPDVDKELFYFVCCELPNGLCVNAELEDCLIQNGIIDFECTSVNCPAPIPTLSQWGLIILALLTLIIGIVSIKQSQIELAQRESV